MYVHLEACSIALQPEVFVLRGSSAADDYSGFVLQSQLSPSSLLMELLN